MLNPACPPSCLSSIRSRPMRQRHNHPIFSRVLDLVSQLSSPGLPPHSRRIFIWLVAQALRSKICIAFCYAAQSCEWCRLDQDPPARDGGEGRWAYRLSRAYSGAWLTWICTYMLNLTLPHPSVAWLGHICHQRSLCVHLHTRSSKQIWCHSFRFLSGNLRIIVSKMYILIIISSDRGLMF